MRKAGLTPVTVWDVKGDRPWKRKEHIRRDAIRQLAMSRLLHEDKRQKRLGRVFEMLEVVSQPEGEAPSTHQFKAIPAESTLTKQPEGDVYHENAANTGRESNALQTDGASPKQSEDGFRDNNAKPRERLTEQRKVQSTEEVRYPGIIFWSNLIYSLATVLQERISTVRIVEELQGLIQEVQLSSRPGSRRGPKEVAQAPENSKEELSTLVESSISEDLPVAEDIDVQTTLEDSEEAILALTDEQDPSEELDIKRALVEPATAYTESPRQMTLTAEEELQLQDLVEAVSSEGDAQIRVVELGKELADLRDRSEVVSRTYRRGHSIPSKWELEECQRLMEVMGVPVILAHPPFEAEGLASAMALAGAADYVGTEDTDVLGYEAPLLRNIASGNKPIEIVDGKALRTAYDLSREQYVDFLILTGTDASSRIPGVGPVKALKLIQKFGSIEAILENDERLRERAGLDYHEEVDAARQLFNVLPPLPSAEELRPKAVPEDTVRDFMKSEHGVILSTASSQPIPASYVGEEPSASYQRAGDEEMAREAFLQQMNLEDDIE